MTTEQNEIKSAEWRKKNLSKNSSLALNGFAMACLELLNFKYLQKMNKEQNV